MRGPLAKSRIIWVAFAYIGGMATARWLSAHLVSSGTGLVGAGLLIALTALGYGLWQALSRRQLAVWAVLLCCALAGFGVYLASLSSASEQFAYGGPGWGLPGLATWMKAGIDASSLPQHAAYIRSILLGDLQGLPQSLFQDYVRSGLVHILSVSGLHVVFVSYAVGLALGLVVRDKRAVVTIQLLAIGAYALACGAATPVMRATAMLSIALVGTLAGKRSSTVSSLALAAILAATLQPTSIATVSFQLSYAAALSLSLLGPVLRSNLLREEWLKGRPAAGYVIDSALVSLSATIGTLPLLAFHFGQVSVISLAANLVAIPMSGAIVVLGLLQAPLGHLCLPIARALGATNGVMIDSLNAVAQGASRVPFASVVIGAPRVWVVVASYAAILWVSSELSPGYFRSALRASRSRVLTAMAVALALLALAGLAGAFREQGKVTFIRVGQGDSILVESGDGRRALVDCGPGAFRPGAPDAGVRYILPYLRKHGLTSLDAIIITHNDLDHIGGAESIIKAVRVGALFRSRGGSETAVSRGVWALARRIGLPIRFLSRGDSISLGRDVALQVLWPSAEALGDSSTGDNDLSIVLRVLSPKRSVLLTGDLEADAEQELVELGNGIAADVLKVGHHGSRSSTSSEFLAAAHPSVSVISVGSNRYGHPNRDVVRRLRASGSRVMRTDLDGNITVDMDTRAEWVHSGGKGGVLGGFGSSQDRARVH